MACWVMIVLLELSAHRVRLVFECSISMDMLHLLAPCVECPENEQRSVTVERLPLGAHEDYPMLRFAFDALRDGFRNIVTGDQSKRRHTPTIRLC